MECLGEFFDVEVWVFYVVFGGGPDFGGLEAFVGFYLFWVVLVVSVGGECSCLFVVADGEVGVLAVAVVLVVVEPVVGFAGFVAVFS